MVGLGVVGLDSDGGAVRGDRLTQLALPVQGIAEIGVGVGVVGPETDDLAEFSGRRAVFPLATAQEVGEAGVGVGEVGLEADGGAVRGDRLIPLRLLLQGEGEAEMRIGVVGPEANGLAIGRRGRLQDGTRFLRAALLLQGEAQAAEVPTVGRSQPPQVLENPDRLGYRFALSTLQGVGQLHRPFLGIERPGRR